MIISRKALTRSNILMLATLYGKLCLTMVENLGCEIMKWPVKWEKGQVESHPIKVDWFSHPNSQVRLGSLFVQVNANQCLGLVDGIETLKQILGT